VKNFVILGAGTAGTMFAHEITRKLDLNEWKVILVDKDDNHFYLRAELPGVKAEDLDIQATGRNVTIVGERKLDTEDASARYHRREREGGRFSRALAMPKEIDADRVEARMQNGMLTLKVPKAESAKPRRVAIGS